MYNVLISQFFRWKSEKMYLNIHIFPTKSKRIKINVCVFMYESKISWKESYAQSYTIWQKYTKISEFSTCLSFLKISFLKISKLIGTSISINFAFTINSDRWHNILPKYEFTKWLKKRQAIFAIKKIIIKFIKSNKALKFINYIIQYLTFTLCRIHRILWNIIEVARMIEKQDLFWNIFWMWKICLDF